MTFRQSNSSCNDKYSKPKSRLNQQIRCDSIDEGCPVLEESGSVCGETDNFDVFHEFRKIYEDCITKLKGSENGNSTLQKLAPFKKLIDDLWEQNAMLVETVEELEQEATCRVNSLQDKLNKSCQKELHCMLKTKEREVECLTMSVSEKDEIIQKYCCQIEELKKELKSKCKKYQEVLKQLKAARNEGKLCDQGVEENPCESEDIQELLNVVLRSAEDQRKSMAYQLQNTESRIKVLAAENKIYLNEKNEIAGQCQCLKIENERLLREMTASRKKSDHEKEELLKTIEKLKSEKNELLQKVNHLHDNVQELNNNFKETRWALTSEVAEKHDQVQELKRSVGMLEEQLRQADMQTHFKDDIIKELRKELKASRKSERRGLFDVVNEVRERRSKCGVNTKSPKSCETIKLHQSTAICSSSTSGFEKQSAKDTSSSVKLNIKRHQAALMCTLNKIEEMLRSLSAKHTCGLSNCKPTFEAELGKISTLKNDLQNQMKCDKSLEEITSVSSSKVRITEPPEKQCNLIHVKDIEKFREKFITGTVTIEQMKEQIDVLEKIIRQYIDEFPCGCDKVLVQKCEDKLGKLHTDYDEISAELHQMTQKLHENCGEVRSGLSLNDSMSSTLGETNISLDVCKLKSEQQKLQLQICEQENAAEKLKRQSKQLDDEIREKRRQLMEYNKEIDSKICEISGMREMIRKTYRWLKEMQCENIFEEDSGDSLSAENTSNLSGLFCDLQKLGCALQNLSKTLLNEPEKLKQDNIKLQEKLELLEKCVCNKEETLRLLQDTVKLRECQIEELKFKMQTSENQSSKLAQDVEEKCRLIANLQEAVRQCKQFEANMEVIESLRFECCDLKSQVKKYEKEILLKDKTLESLHNEITDLSSKNFLLTEKIKIIEPKLKIMYKTCHLFEKAVNELQQELNSRECEIENLYAKIKELEGELNAEFRKCEDKAADDSKYIEDLSITVKNFQKELQCAQDYYNLSIVETEQSLRKEFEARENKLNSEICQLRAELLKLKSEAQSKASKNDGNETQPSKTKSQQEMLKNRIEELENCLKKNSEEHEREIKTIFEKLCNEKEQNLKNKNLITKLNENIRMKILQEKKIKECIEHCSEDIKNLKAENQDLKNEVEVRKKIMCAMEKEDGADLTEFEELLCSLKIQKADLKTKCCNLKAEAEKEAKLNKYLECRLNEVNAVLQCKLEEFNKAVENYKCTSARIKETCEKMKKIEESFICSQNNAADRNCNEEEDQDLLKKLLDLKASENAKLMCQIQVLKVDLESIQSESALIQANKDATISHLQQEVECLAMDVEEFQTKYLRMEEEYKKLRCELDYWMNKGNTMHKAYKEKQKDLNGKLKTTICEKNNLLGSLDDLQKQFEEVCLENLNKEKKNRELAEECSKLKLNNDSSDSAVRSKSVKIICNLSKEIQNLQCELITAKESLKTLNEEYHTLLEQYKCSEKKKCNIEKLFTELLNENKSLVELKTNYERELSELKAQNLLLKDKLGSKDFCKSPEDKKIYDVVKELIGKIKTLEKNVIPELQQEINEKMCCIENLKMELREANISNQKMRNEALRVIQHTRKYLAAQRCANDTLKTRLECSNKRGNMLGIENRELEDQLKAVTRMNEFLLCQLESNKTDVEEIEPCVCSPLPWGCSTVERDTSSSEYLAESGFQSMQPSPTNMDCIHDSQFDQFKRNTIQWSSLKKHKTEHSSCRNGIR